MEAKQHTCWYSTDGAAEMNRFYDLEVRGHDLSNHGHIKVFCELLSLCDRDPNNPELMDIGCGTAMLSEYTKPYEYHGIDLPHIIAGCAMRNYPNNWYQGFDIYKDDLKIIKQYKVVVANGFIDVMQYPLDVLGDILENAREWVILHRQEISKERDTHVIENGSYGGVTYHSIINRQDFLNLIEEHNFDIVRELACPFANWEGGGSSFLLRKRKSWALDQMDYKLKEIMGSKRDGIFIEAGANDGLRQSNTMFFEFYKNWTGILVEPVTDQYLQCKENRSAKTNVFNCALVNWGYHLPTIDILYTESCHGLMSCVKNDYSHITMERAHEKNPKRIEVAAHTLDELIKLAGLEGKTIDLLVLDVEGFEWKALKGIDLQKRRVDWILVEEREDIKEKYPELNIGKLLEKEGYALNCQLSDQDYLYQRLVKC